MCAKLLVVLALSALTVRANNIVDDSACRWNKSQRSCEPTGLCHINFKIGDFTKDQACRVKDDVNFYPQQIHLAYAGKETGTAMTISWATSEYVTDSAVWVGSSKKTLKLVNTAVSSRSYYSGKEYNMFHHHATVTGLEPFTKYFYKVGSRNDETYTSDVSTFVTARPATDQSTFNALIYGDLGDGVNSAETIEAINKLTSNDIDLVYHLGDISYADTDFVVLKQATGFFYEEVYNKWMNSLMPLMSRVPYMVLVGNHEAECHSPRCQLSKKKLRALGNYTAYNARFKMPHEESGGTLNMWYSFDHGPIHFTSLSAETDYPGAPTNEFTKSVKNGNFGNQLSWVEADLKKAAANRGNVPWIIVGMHRPLYSVDDSANDVPIGQSKYIQTAFEDLFLKYKVDVVLSGHKHYYERELPTARNKAVMSGVSNDFKVYNNPQAPVHILTGAAGQVEGVTNAPQNKASWNVASDYKHFGYSVLRANRTALSWKYVLSSDQSVADEFVMLKTGTSNVHSFVDVE